MANDSVNSVVGRHVFTVVGDNLIDEDEISENTIKQALAEAQDAGSKRMREIEQDKKRIEMLFAGTLYSLRIESSWMSMHQQSLDNLRNGEWLNGDIVDSFTLIVGSEQSRVWTVPYFIFRPDVDDMLQRAKDDLVCFFTRNGEFFKKQRHLICIPMNSNGNHWTLFIIDWELSIIYHLDSLRNIGTSRRVQNIARKLVKLLDEISSQSSDTLATHPIVDWTLKLNQECPLQANAKDCGVFVCYFVQSVTKFFSSADRSLENWFHKLIFTNPSEFRTQIERALRKYITRE